MATLSTVLFFVLVLLLSASAVLGRQPDTRPAGPGALLLAVGVYAVYEYVSQRAYENFNIRADLLILVLLLGWAAWSNLSTPRPRSIDGPDFRRQGAPTPPGLDPAPDAAPKGADTGRENAAGPDTPTR